MIITLIIFLAINLLLAFIDSRRIRNKKGIAHWLNGLVYLILTGGAVWFNGLNWWLIPALFLERLIIFQIGLSIFRKLKWSYITPAPTAITDKIQVAVFGHNNGLVMYTIYALLFIATLFIIFL